MTFCLEIHRTDRRIMQRTQLILHTPPSHMTPKKSLLWETHWRHHRLCRNVRVVHSKMGLALSTRSCPHPSSKCVWYYLIKVKDWPCLITIIRRYLLWYLEMWLINDFLISSLYFFFWNYCVWLLLGWKKPIRQPGGLWLPSGNGIL